MSGEAATRPVLGTELPARLGDPLASSASRAAGHRVAQTISRRAGTAFRLAVLQALVLAAILAASITALLHTTQLGVQEIAVRQLRAELDSYQRAASSDTGTSLQALSIAYLRSHAVPERDLVEVSVPGSWAVANAGGGSVASAPTIAALAGVVPPRTRVRPEQVAGRDLQVLVTPIREGGRPVAVFLAAVDLTDLKPAGDAALRLAIGEGAVAVVAGVAGAYLLLRRLLRRIGRITETAERIGRDQLDDRLGDQGTTDEVGHLAASFDSMLDRIESAVAAQHELLSDVSHQLRTPLTVARGHLEILGRTGAAESAVVRDAVDVAIGELDRMGGLVERLLTLGRAREPVRRDVHDVDLGSFLGDVFGAARVLAERQWSLDPPPDAVVRFDEAEVRGALLNLLDNAVRATRPGDTVRLSARVAAGMLSLSVDDSGPGIPEPDRQLVLDRFTRAGDHHGYGGTGLGLAIASAVCRAHGGTLEIGESDLGGAKVTMTIRPLGPRGGP